MAFFNSANLRKFLENMVEPTTANPNVENTQQLNPEKNWYSKWLSPQFGGKQMPSMNQIGGQDPMKGTDILKYVRQHDPQNTAGANKHSLDIMEKLQNVNENDALYNNIQPMQDILGGDLYGKMKSGGAGAKAANKTEEKEDIIAALIAAAIDCTARKSGEDAEEASEKLNNSEIDNIESAFYGKREYKSQTMPETFVTCINQLMPTYRAREAANG
jgi:hypothetical protein